VPDDSLCPATTEGQQASTAVHLQALSFGLPTLIFAAAMGAHGVPCDKRVEALLGKLGLPVAKR
jgi:hypothetical protein